MIDFNDRFTGLMIGLIILMIFFGYIALFGKVDKKSKVDKS